MKYISTRGFDGEFDFCNVLYAGYAPDGGLFVPREIPRFSEEQLLSYEWLPFCQLAFHIIRPFVGQEIPNVELQRIISSAYSGFSSRAVAPLYQTDSNEWILELFHGPSRVYQDFGLQLMAGFVEYFTRLDNKPILIVGCTGGDTGAAAISAFTDMPGVKLLVLHPSVGIEPESVNRMVKMAGPNVLNASVKGSYSDCHKLCEHLLGVREISGMKLISFNSISWVRILAQLPFYFYSALQLGAPRRQVAFSVPTGNFGSLYAAYMSKMMGLSINQLLVVTNRNDGLHRFISSNTYSKSEISETNTPSMNVSIASNFERFMWNILDGDGEQVAQNMALLESNDTVRMKKENWLEIRELFDSLSVDDEKVSETAQFLEGQNSYSASKNTAAGVYAARSSRRSLLIPMICLATTRSLGFNSNDENNLLSGRKCEFECREIGNNYNELEALVCNWARL
ncbi:Threonine synthase [compost metagenome]